MIIINLDYDHGKYIENFDKLMADNIAARLAQTKLPTIEHAVKFVKEKAYFDDKFLKIDKKLLHKIWRLKINSLIQEVKLHEYTIFTKDTIFCKVKRILQV